MELKQNQGHLDHIPGNSINQTNSGIETPILEGLAKLGTEYKSDQQWNCPDISGFRLCLKNVLISLPGRA